MGERAHRVEWVRVGAATRCGAGSRARLGALVVVGILLGMGVATGLIVALGNDGLAGLGSPDPGLITRAVLPAVRVLCEGAAVVAVGSLLLAAFLLPPQPSGFLDTGGYAAIRIARIAALIWALTAALRSRCWLRMPWVARLPMCWICGYWRRWRPACLRWGLGRSARGSLRCWLGSAGPP
jgi:hypothetical protein